MRWVKCENEEKKCDYAQTAYRQFVCESTAAPTSEVCSLVYEGNSSRKEKYSYIYPIRSFAEASLQSVEYARYREQTYQHALKLHREEIFNICAEKRALNKSEQKHWKEQELHMLPGGFVYPGEQGTEFAVEPFVQKVQQSAKGRYEYEACHLPPENFSFYLISPFYSKKIILYIIINSQ